MATVKVEQIEKNVAELVESAKAPQRELLIELSGLYEAKDSSPEKELGTGSFVSMKCSCVDSARFPVLRHAFRPYPCMFAALVTINIPPDVQR
jgi:hypothetical protein